MTVAALAFLDELSARSRADGTIRLYHFTRPASLPAILADGFLDVTYGGLRGKRRDHNMTAPDCLWLTTNGTGIGDLTPVDGAVRFAVSVPQYEVYTFAEWGRLIGEDAMVDQLDGRVAFARDTRVIQRPVWRDEWLEIRDMTTGLPIQSGQRP